MSYVTGKIGGLILALCAIAALAGCVSIHTKLVTPDSVPLYGDTPMCHTVYIGSDDRYHYFSWIRGFRGGKVKVIREQLHLSREFPRGAGHEFMFLTKKPDGGLDVRN